MILDLLGPERPCDEDHRKVSPQQVTFLEFVTMNRTLHHWASDERRSWGIGKRCLSTNKA